jgi:endoribonuclease Dicer
MRLCDCRDLPPGRLHDLLSASVNNTRLAAVAVVNRLHANLWHTSALLHREMSSFAEAVAAAASRRTLPSPAGAGGSAATVASAQVRRPTAEAAASDARVAQYAWATAAGFGGDVDQPPKVLADLVESVLGAVFLDTGRDLEATWQVLCKP